MKKTTFSRRELLKALGLASTASIMEATIPGLAKKSFAQSATKNTNFAYFHATGGTPHLVGLRPEYTLMYPGFSSSEFTTLASGVDVHVDFANAYSAKAKSQCAFVTVMPSPAVGSTLTHPDGANQILTCGGTSENALTKIFQTAGKRLAATHVDGTFGTGGLRNCKFNTAERLYAARPLIDQLAGTQIGGGGSPGVDNDFKKFSLQAAKNLGMERLAINPLALENFASSLASAIDSIKNVPPAPPITDPAQIPALYGSTADQTQLDGGSLHPSCAIAELAFYAGYNGFIMDTGAQGQFDNHPNAMFPYRHEVQNNYNASVQAPNAFPLFIDRLIQRSETYGEDYLAILASEFVNLPRSDGGDRGHQGVAVYIVFSNRIKSARVYDDMVVIGNGLYPNTSPASGYAPPYQVDGFWDFVAHIMGVDQQLFRSRMPQKLSDILV